MFLKQREYTDRVYLKCIQGERRRLIKSANRRYANRLGCSTAAAQKSQFGLLEPKEWRSKQYALLVNHDSQEASLN